MKKNKFGETRMQREFEIGPIRPPSEAESLLIRVTRNCSWNKCKFCAIYRNQRFSVRSVEDVKEDIDTIAAYRENILRWAAEGSSSYEHIQQKLNELPEETAQKYMHVLQWINNGEESVFLQDANTVVLTFDKLKAILEHLRTKLPQIKRVTSYGRVESLAKFSVEQLTELRKAGLDRIHSGFESGSDKVLELISKGYTKAQEIEAGQKVKASGMELSVYYMPGVGGKELSDDNAIETADVVSQTNPDFVRIRTFVSHKTTELMEEIISGRMTECTDFEKMLELKKMIENIHDADGMLYSDHIINLHQNVYGNLKTDKQRMLSVFEEFEKLDKHDQLRYQLARRMGRVGQLSDMKYLGEEQIVKIDNYLSQLTNDEEFENFLLRFLRHYI
jgi:radical SAM superfamily enzyme YgiQ (UPF0313 family)